MHLDDRIAAAVTLGHALRQLDEATCAALATQSAAANPWLTTANIQHAFSEAAHWLRDPEALHAWAAPYAVPPARARRVGVLMSGQAPADGLPDALAVLLTGHTLYARLAPSDVVVMGFVLARLGQTHPGWADRLVLADRLTGVEALVMPEGPTATHLARYFAPLPRLVRTQQTGVAVLTGEETAEERQALGAHIFRYFGRHRRSVTQLYLPPDYRFQPLLESLHHFQPLLSYSRYAERYEYGRAICLLKKIPYLDWGPVVMIESVEPFTAPALLHYQHYADANALREHLRANARVGAVFADGDSWPHARRLGHYDAQMPDDRASETTVRAFLAAL